MADERAPKQTMPGCGSHLRVPQGTAGTSPLGSVGVSPQEVAVAVHMVRVARYDTSPFPRLANCASD